MMEDMESKTFGVSWYVEVDAETAEDAEAKAREFLAPKYRKHWLPLNVEEVDPEVEATGERI